MAERDSNSAAASSSPGDSAYTTHVSESDRRPCASATCSESDAPTEHRSETRCNTATLETPKARESFHDDCSQRATPRFERIAHASSTTRKKPPRPNDVPPALTAVRPGRDSGPGGGAGHQDAEGGRRIQRGEIEDDEGRGQIKAGRGGAVEQATRSPCTRRRSSSATSRPSSRRSCCSVRNERAASTVGVRRASTTTGTVGTGVARVASARATPSAARSRAPGTGRGRHWPVRRGVPSSGARWHRARPHRRHQDRGRAGSAGWHRPVAEPRDEHPASADRRTRPWGRRPRPGDRTRPGARGMT